MLQTAGISMVYGHHELRPLASAEPSGLCIYKMLHQSAVSLAGAAY